MVCAGVSVYIVASLDFFSMIGSPRRAVQCRAVLCYAVVCWDVPRCKIGLGNLHETFSRILLNVCFIEFCRDCTDANVMR